MIKFGTDGWRARIADDFTFENVRKVTAAFINWLQSEKLDKQGIAVGFDNRFQSEDFAKTAAEVSARAGIKTFLSAISLPSPALSYYVKSNNLGAGIMITASHNPPEWNGFKIKESWGGSARPEVTKKVEAFLGSPINLRLNAAVKMEPRGSLAGSIVSFDPKTNYLKHISTFVDLELIKKSKIYAVLDPMYGSGAGYLKDILNIEEIRGFRDPTFGGINPEPIPVNLEETFSFMRDVFLKYPDTLSAGIVLDGDADRIGAVDPTGTYISSHNVFSLLLYHLVKNRKMTGKVVKTFNISRLVEKQAQKYGLPLQEVPIGFKHIADIMLKEKVLIGGEESGGLGIQGNIPERDGSLCALLLLELMAYEKKSLKQILDTIMDELGHYYYDRVDLHTDKKSIGDAPKTFAGQEVVKVETLDGTKLNFKDGAWILFRPSGTEPLLRIYAEAPSAERVEYLLSEGQRALTQV